MSSITKFIKSQKNIETGFANLFVDIETGFANLFVDATHKPIEFDETLDVNELLKNVVETEYDPKLISRTLSTIKNITIDTITTIQNKLKLYRLVDDVFALHKGKHIRWINKEDKTHKLYTGGIAVDVKFYDNGTQILIFNKYLKRNFQIHFDKVFLFQKLSFEEEIILHLKRTI
jgi:hypothetical protein